MLPPRRSRPVSTPPAATAPGKLRIIAGSLRNSRLAVPDRPGLRPTPERVRETLFNWLMPVLPGARCLDLFAGTGALGIEALSRGAGEVVFVERDAALAAALRANLERLRQLQVPVVCADALNWLREPQPPFDIVFLDPPFALDLWQAAAQVLLPSRRPPRSTLLPCTALFRSPRANLGRLHREGRAGEVRYALYRAGGAG